LRYESGFEEHGVDSSSFRVRFGASIGDHEVLSEFPSTYLPAPLQRQDIIFISLETLFDPSKDFIDSEGKLKIEMKVRKISKNIFSKIFQIFNFFFIVYQ
jgi:hypothetical protein